MEPYPSFDAVLDEAARHGTPHEIGRSVQGRPLVRFDLPGDGPPVTVTAGLHGIEAIGVAVALEVLRRGPLDGARLSVVPVCNPDGYVRTFALGGRGPVRTMRKNARGVDLNRNFPMPWGARPGWLPTAGSTNPTAATYRGPAPRSEPEVDALAAWLEGLRPHASANLHSFLGALIPARVWHGPDWRGYGTLCRAFRRGQRARPGYVRLATPFLDVFTGELEDWQHHVLGCWAVCVECFSLRESLVQHLRAPNAFWRFNPRDPDPVVQRDAPAVRAMLEAAARMPRPPRRAPARITRETW